VLNTLVGAQKNDGSTQVQSPMKINFTQLIRDESAAFRALNERVHATFRSRESGRHSRDAWSQACHEFHTYKSRLDPYQQRAFQDNRYSDQELIESWCAFSRLTRISFGPVISSKISSPASNGPT
jgi:hypothetical protein